MIGAYKKTSGRAFSLDPRTKLLMVPIAGIAVFAVDNALTIFLMSFLVAALLLLSGSYKTMFGFLMFFSVTLLLDSFAGATTNMTITILLLVLLYVFQRFAMLAMLGAYVAGTTKPAELICAMEKLGLPRQICVPLAVSFRFMPTIREEYGYLKDSMKIRGIDVTFTGFLRHPAKVIEYTIVPLLMRSFRIADELAASAMVRGIDSGRKKTPLSELSLKAVDYFTVLCFTVCIAGLFIIDKFM
ncbi:MAG: energy-coupling factor transporter transmembrane component T [Anaerotignum sp.]|nr:energy-coupling factor transporter transmembrane component T [Anaerotignum sp.]